MTHIRGSVTKIKEITKDAFTQPVGAGTPKQLYFAYGLATAIYTIPNLFTGNYAVATGNQVMLHSFNISCGNTNLNNIWFVKADGTLLGDFFFRYDSKLQFSLGDIILTKEEAEGFLMYIENTGAGANFYGTIYYVDIPLPT